MYKPTFQEASRGQTARYHRVRDGELLQQNPFVSQPSNKAEENTVILYLETIAMQFLGLWPRFDGVYLLRGVWGKLQSTLHLQTRQLTTASLAQIRDDFHPSPCILQMHLLGLSIWITGSVSWRATR